MNYNWLSRIRGLMSSAGSAFFDDFDADADGRRVRSELDAIRARFPDHA
ncbi:hypothetical protein LV457_18955 [Mycobacterium sp. MYCO198283]|nr:hypothetical protein [Mycobacterium sp. MYCO198283]MCG5434354.1 hypothetical protein [Mycobacterium sp. MYCO198283]